MHPFLCFCFDQGYFGLGRRRHQPNSPKGREILQEETPKAPVHPGEEDPQEERGERCLSEAQAQHRSVRA